MSAELSGWQRTLIVEDVLEGPTDTSTRVDPLPYPPLLRCEMSGALFGVVMDLLTRPTTEAERLHVVWRLAQHHRFSRQARRLAEILDLPLPLRPGRLAA